MQKRFACDTCPARSKRVRSIQLGDRKLALCPLCVKALERVISRPQISEAAVK